MFCKIQKKTFHHGLRAHQFPKPKIRTLHSSGVLDIPSGVRTDNYVGYSSLDGNASEDDDVFLPSSTMTIIEHAEAQTDVPDVENATIQTDKSNCCSYYLENNLMLREILKQLKQTENPQACSLAAQGHSQDTPSTLEITLSPGLLVDQLVP
nr:PREDICTED: uncharacterized protein LOC106703444 [Latimeria chalumnae]|eukprot:XP_014343810.1 PREDICTED: uncharacterized protein LOC106703444 [Latimeria chalumnae]